MFAYYTAIIFITIFSMLTMLLMVWKTGWMPRPQKHCFAAVFLMVMLASSAEWLGVFLDGAPAWTRLPHILVKMVELSVAPSIPLVFAGIICPPEQLRRFFPLLGIHTVLEMLSARFGFIYTVNDTNYYLHGRFYWIYLVVTMLLCLFCVREYLKFSRRYQQGGYSAVLLLVLLLMLGGLVVQSCNRNLRIDYLCAAVGVILVYLYYADLTQHVDSMTGLLNRNCYEITLTSLRSPAVFLLFDVNNFKATNDSYGHFFGDRCLSVIGQCIFRVYSRYGRCYRIGGDEFFVLLQNSTAEKDLNAQFFALLTEERKQLPHLPLVSIGTASFHPETDDVEEVFRAADHDMYRWKKFMKEQHGDAPL